MKNIVTTTEAARPVGPYSQGIIANGFVFVSGQTPLDPLTGKFVDGDVVVQTEQILRSISAILESAGTSIENVVKTTVFLADMNDFASMNEVYSRFFKAAPPARSTIQVARLPLDAQVEIEAIAIIEPTSNL